MTHVPDWLDFSRAVLRETVRPGDLAVDATLGNGRDASLLAGLVGPQGRVWCFDVQDLAIRRARQRLAEAGLLGQVEMIHAGHEALGAWLPASALGRVRAATFNLGYLPGGDRRVVTRPATTLAALRALEPFMAQGGVISLAVYAGHAGGPEEAEAVAAWCAGLDQGRWRAMRYGQVNRQANREELYLLERLGQGGK